MVHAIMTNINYCHSLDLSYFRAQIFRYHFNVQEDVIWLEIWFHL